MFSGTADYALRAVCVVARGQGTSQTTEEIAAATQVPMEYLRKDLQFLSRGGIVSTQRGTGGGVTLARPNEQISVLDVVNAVDPIQRIDHCPLGLAEHDVALCPMHSELDRAPELMEQALGSTAIADLLKSRSRRASRCQFPNVRQG